MRYKMLDTSLAMTMAWMWLVIVVTAVVGYDLFRWWRRRHPLPVPKPEPPYAQGLQRRLIERAPRSGQTIETVEAAAQTPASPLSLGPVATTGRAPSAQGTTA